MTQSYDTLFERRSNAGSRCWWLLVLLIGACAAPPPPSVPIGMPDGFPERRYREARTDDIVYAVDASRTLVTAYVYRGGALARMGHDHVIASRDVAGFVLLGPNERGARRIEADLYAPLAAMTVDEDALRAEAGFTTEPSASDREGTRGNMLKSLEAGDYPFVRISLRTAMRLEMPHSGDVDASISLHGVTRLVSVPVTVRVGSRSLAATGSFTLRQTEFGVTPFSVLGGALAVKDEVDLRFELHARRVRPATDRVTSRR